jgi:hypothetical protein
VHLASDAPRPAWAVPETAWFLALIGGFATTWVGAVIGISGVGPLLAAVLATWYQAVLHRRREHGAAGMVAAAAILGVLVAAIGLVVETGFDPARRAFPLASAYVRAAVEPLYLVPAGRVGAATWFQVALAAGACGLGLLLARPTRGLVPLLGACGAAGALGIAAPAAAAGGTPMDPYVLLALHSLPPWALLQLLGVVLLQSVLASPEHVLPLDELPAGRRRLLLVGAPALGLGLLLQPFLALPWGRWVPVP